MKPVVRATSVLWLGSLAAAAPFALALFVVAQSHAGKSVDAAQFAAARDPLLLVDFLMSHDKLWAALLGLGLVAGVLWVPFRVWLSGMSLALLAGANLRESALKATDSLWTLLKLLAMGMLMLAVAVLPFALIAGGLTSLVEDSARSTRASMQAIGMMLVVGSASSVAGVWALARCFGVRSPELGAWWALKSALRGLRRRPGLVIAAALVSVAVVMLLSSVALWLDLRIVESSAFLWFAAAVLQQLVAWTRSFCWVMRDCFVIGLTDTHSEHP